MSLSLWKKTAKTRALSRGLAQESALPPESPQNTGRHLLPILHFAPKPSQQCEMRNEQRGAWRVWDPQSGAWETRSESRGRGKVVEGVGFEPTKRVSAMGLQPIPINHSGTPPRPSARNRAPKRAGRCRHDTPRVKRRIGRIAHGALALTWLCQVGQIGREKKTLPWSATAAAHDLIGSLCDVRHDYVGCSARRLFCRPWHCCARAWGPSPRMAG
jgi:hypothetical protein